MALGAAIATWLVCAVAWGADWPDERRIGRFIVRADFDLTSLEPRLAELDRLERDITNALALPQTVDQPPLASIEVYLFAGEAAYRHHLAQVLPSSPDRRALYVKSAGRGRVYAFRSRSLPEDLRHECTHALLHAALPAIPLWLDEGLAEYFEVPGEVRSTSGPRLAEMNRWLNRHKQVPTLSSLEQRVAPHELTVDDYRDAWAWVHFLLHGPPEAREELVRYLQELTTNESPVSLSSRLARRWPNLDERFAQHFRKA
jgi:hypothetical protein